MEKMKLKYEQEAAMIAAKKAFTPPSDQKTHAKSTSSSSTSSDNVASSSSSSSSSFGSKVVDSVKKHPFLWGMGIGAAAIATGGLGLYSALPFTTKLGLALL